MGYAVDKNKKEMVEAISSIPGVYFSIPVSNFALNGSLAYALDMGHLEIAIVLANKEAKCSQDEIVRLGKKYTDFQIYLEMENEYEI